MANKENETRYARSRHLSKAYGEGAHYASVTVLNLNHTIDVFINEIAQETYQQPYPYHMAAYQHPDRQSLPGFKRKIYNKRHGMRLALAAQILLNFYKKFGNSHFSQEMKALLNLMPGNTQRAQSDNFLKLLQITAFYYDAGRQSDQGENTTWQMDAAGDCEIYIRSLLLNSRIKREFANFVANSFAQAIRDTLSTENKYHGIIERILHDANELEKMRLASRADYRKNLFSRHFFAPRTQHFRLENLSFSKDCLGAYDKVGRTLIDQEERFKAQDEITRLALEWREFARASFDLQTSTAIEMQIKNEMVMVSHGLLAKKKLAHQAAPGLESFGEIQNIINNIDFPFLYDHLNNYTSEKRTLTHKIPALEKYLPLRMASTHLEFLLDHYADSKEARKVRNAVQDLYGVLLNKHIQQTGKFAAIQTFHDEMASFRYTKAPLAAALAFVAITAMALTLSVTVGFMIAVATGAISAPTLPLLFQQFASVLTTTQKGCLIGGSLTIGCIGAKYTHFKKTHSILEDGLSDFEKEAVLAVKLTT